MMTFTKATKHSRKLRMALAGPAGSGKTKTALTIATALGARIAMIDTERGGGNYYADQFDFDSLELTSFHPERYMEALAAAAAAGYHVVIIDSLSHAWMGKDGALELVDRAVKARQSGGNSFAAWRDVTPLHNRLVDAMLQAPFHLLVTLRSKTEYVLETDVRGKQVPRKVGMAPVQRDGLEYEFDVVADMDHTHIMTVNKSRVDGLADLVVEKPGCDFGQRILMALTTGVVASPQSARPAASPAASPVIKDPEAHEWMGKLNALMVEYHATQEEMERFWRHVAHRHGDAFTATLGRKLYGELQVRLAKKAQAEETPPTPEAETRTGDDHAPEAPAQEPPAPEMPHHGSPVLAVGEAGFTYIAQIEAVVAAQKADLEKMWLWGERQIGKARDNFTVSDYVALLKMLRERAQEKNIALVSEYTDPTQPALVGVVTEAANDSTDPIF